MGHSFKLIRNFQACINLVLMKGVLMWHSMKFPLLSWMDIIVQKNEMETKLDMVFVQLSEPLYEFNAL